MDANLTFKVPAYLLTGEYLNVKSQTADGFVIDCIASIEAIDSYHLRITTTGGSYHTVGMEQVITHANNGGQGGLTTADYDLIMPLDIKADLTAFDGLIAGAVAMVGNLNSGTVDPFKYQRLMSTLKAVNEGAEK